MKKIISIKKDNKDKFKRIADRLCNNQMMGALAMYSLFVVSYLRMKHNFDQDISYLIYVPYTPYIIGFFMQYIYLSRQPITTKTEQPYTFINFYTDIKNGFIYF